jgi:hypothetical protein
MMSLFLLTLLGVITTIFDAPSVDNGEYSLFISCFTNAVGLWLSGNSFYNSSFFANFNIIALGITLFCVLALYTSVKNLDKRPFSAVISGSVAYTVFVYLVYAFQNHEGGIDVLPHLSLPFILAIIVISMANTEGSSFNALREFKNESRLLKMIPKYVILALRGSISFVACLLIVSAGFLLYGLFSSLDAQQTILDALNAGPWAALTISLFSICFLPNVIVFTMSLIFSDGFFFGDSAQVSTTYSGLGHDIPPFPLASADLYLVDNPLPNGVGFAIMIVFAILISFWQTRKLNNDRLFPAWSKGRLVVSELAYLLLTQLITILLIFVSIFFLGYVSSGRVGTKIGYIGVDKMISSIDIMEPFAIGCLVILLGFAFYKINRIMFNDDENSQTNVILKEEVKKITRRSSNADEKKIRSKERGSRSASSTI